MVSLELHWSRYLCIWQHINDETLTDITLILNSITKMIIEMIFFSGCQITMIYSEETRKNYRNVHRALLPNKLAVYL